MAAAAPQLQPETAPQEAPKEAPQETPVTEPAPEHWTKKPFEGGSLGAAEDLAELRGMGKVMGEKAAAETKNFDEETKSLWGRVKGRLFRKKEGVPEAPPTPTAAKGEAEILAEIEKADATFANFRKEMAEIMASGDEAQLRVLERNLSAAYEQIAPQVAAEGAADSAAWKKALKTGEEPPMSVAGAQLNYVTKRLADVRAKLAGKMPTPESAAGAPETAPEQPAAEAVPAPEQTQAEKDLDDDIARGVAEFEAEQAAANAAKPPATPIPSLNEVLTGIPDSELAKGWKPADPGPMTPEESPEEPPQKPDAKTMDRDALLALAAGKPGEKMVDEFIQLRDLGEDSYGKIVDKSFDPLKGEIRLVYENGDEYRKYSTGTVLRVLQGGDQVAVDALPKPRKPQALIVEDEPEASSEPVPGTHIDHLAQDEPGEDAAATEGGDATRHESKEGSNAMTLGELMDAVQKWERNSMFDAGVAEKFFKENPDFAAKHAQTRMEADEQLANTVRVAEYLRRIALNASPGETAESVLQRKREELEAKKTGATPEERALIDDEERLLDRTMGQLGAAEALKAKHGEPAIEKYPNPEIDAKGWREMAQSLSDRYQRQKEKFDSTKDPAARRILEREIQETMRKQSYALGKAGELENPPVETQEAPPSAVEPSPAPEAPAAPAPAVEAAPERKESGFDKLEAKIDAAAAEIIKMMSEEAKSPNTFRAKVGKLPAKKILEAYVASGAVTEAEAKTIDGELKVAGEEFNDFRKKLAKAAEKKLKG